MQDIIVAGVHFNPKVWRGLNNQKFFAKAKALAVFKDQPDALKELRDKAKSLAVEGPKP